MSSNETHTARRATRWIRLLAVVVTVGFLASVGVHLGAYGQRVVAELSTWFDRTPFGTDPESLSVVPTLLHDASVIGGILTIAGAGWLALVLLVRVAVGLSASA